MWVDGRVGGGGGGWVSLPLFIYMWLLLAFGLVKQRTHFPTGSDVALWKACHPRTVICCICQPPCAFTSAYMHTFNARAHSCLLPAFS